jgi:hypothetical protein
VSFIKAVYGCTYANANRIAIAFNNTETMTEWRTLERISQGCINLCHSFNITDDVIKELDIKNRDEGTICFPVAIKGKLIDIRTYTPGGNPKVKSRLGAPYGLIIPLDIWQTTPVNRITLVCAGEKDMAVARSFGFNAITLTGGEETLPISPEWFRNRDVVIVYDHDDAGINGAHKLASYLIDYCHTVKVCTGFHEICKEDKEDITDFFNKYRGTRDQLIAYINDAPIYTHEDCIRNSNIPKISVQEATSGKFLNKIVRSNIQVTAVSEVQYALPSTIVAEKYELAGTKDDTMSIGEAREWSLSDDTVQDILYLIDNNLTEMEVNNNAKLLTHVPIKERFISVHKYDKIIVYKAYVTEMFESINTNTMPMEYTVYSVGTRLESGKKYMATYKLVPHPFKGQQLIMIILNAVSANDSVSSFVLTDKNIENLKIVQDIKGSVADKVHTLVQKAKGLVGYNGIDQLILLLDLAYHTVLTFNFGHFKDVRGYLDMLIVGESRIGKSSTAEVLRQTYQLGTFASLAGNSATVPGLIGGSGKTPNGAYQTKAGLIPQNHKGLIIFEEFGKCKNDIITELTDIRSSNEVRITRISGTMSLPAMVRMVALSNVKTVQGEIKSIAAYPNGISVITELVSTAEDIARYDILAVFGEKGDAIIDPFWTPDEPLPISVYQTKVRWVWSRKPEDVIINEEVGRYIIEQANALNKEYNCHIKIFGTEAWKKLSRLAISIAAYVVSTDETYNNVIVSKEHVDYAVQLYHELYDNKTFRLKEYVANERKYNEIDKEGIELLQQLYAKCPALLVMLEQEARVSRNSLMAAVGLDNAMYNGFMNQLVSGSFVKLISNDILPTERFRLGMTQINHNITLRKLGENNVAN